jgi:hypothetical protein
MEGLKRLPLGVAVLAVLVGIFGAIVLAGGLFVIAAALFHAATSGSAAAFGTGILSGLITLVIGAIILAVAFGLWGQELWAFVLALIAVGAAVIWFVGLPLYHGEGISSIANVPAVVSVVLFIYLLAVHDAFY